MFKRMKKMQQNKKQIKFIYECSKNQEKIYVKYMHLNNIETEKRRKLLSYDIVPINYYQFTII